MHSTHLSIHDTITAFFPVNPRKPKQTTNTLISQHIKHSSFISQQH